MKIPKYIDEALHKRTSSACKLLKYDDIITSFIDKYHIGVNYEDYEGGCEMFTNPYKSEEAVRQAILNHNKRKEVLNKIIKLIWSKL